MMSIEYSMLAILQGDVARLRHALRLVIRDADEQQGEKWVRIRASTELACRQALAYAERTTQGE